MNRNSEAVVGDGATPSSPEMVSAFFLLFGVLVLRWTAVKLCLTTITVELCLTTKTQGDEVGWILHCFLKVPLLLCDLPTLDFCLGGNAL